MRDVSAFPFEPLVSFVFNLLFPVSPIIMLYSPLHQFTNLPIYHSRNPPPSPRFFPRVRSLPEFTPRSGARRGVQSLIP